MFSRASHLTLVACFGGALCIGCMYFFCNCFSRVSRVLWSDYQVVNFFSVQWYVVLYFSSSSDVDECSSNITNPCQFTCINTLGSYKCDCPVGYHLSADGKKCQGWLFTIYAHAVKMNSFAFLTKPVIKIFFCYKSCDWTAHLENITPMFLTLSLLIQCWIHWNEIILTETRAWYFLFLKISMNVRWRVDRAVRISVITREVVINASRPRVLSSIIRLEAGKYYPVVTHACDHCLHGHYSPLPYLDSSFKPVRGKT